ncbi:hypothetical protein LTR56_023271 [Elasticomyces elasticus]|nr:hypothetical protein LTR56_023271 [Elasticomyces elasticus]KAK3624168.1 hypothetical protein LTR22_024073 [Elasticomyces elasticus]KAK4906374.1 hypothetical protein LTR49_024455 [Elasticomyces elasticus]KAK5744639.1 hypothetical protein LTS12_023414 [Elasticomyces elasticus]
MEASTTTKDATPKVEDMTFLFFLLNAHKQGAWKFQLCADKLGLPSAKAAESKYYRLKKLYFDAVGGAEMMDGIQGAETPKKEAKKAATPKGKKRQLETDGDDEETPIATVKGKGKGSAKKAKVEVKAGEDEEVAAKAELEEDL